MEKDAEILSVGKIAEFAKFAEGERRKSPDRYLFNRAKRVMDGRGLTGCRSAADAAWQSSDTALPIRASLLTACPAEVLPRVLFVQGFSESLRICWQSSYSRPCEGIEGCLLTAGKRTSADYVLKKVVSLQPLWGFLNLSGYYSRYLTAIP